jgi:hypothetical protein
MKSNVKGLILAVLMIGVQSLVAGNAFADQGTEKISVKAEFDESAAFPRSAMDD